MTAGIYIFQHLESRKQYVGQSTDIDKRIKQHLWSAAKGSEDCSKFYRALRKHGPDAFSITKGLFPESLEDHPQRKLLLDIAEKVCIRILEANLNGYNLKDGGANGVPNDETRRKMSEALKGRVLSEEHKAKLSEAWKGRVVSEETKRKMSASQKGKVLSDETRRKLSEALKGRVLSDETKRKMSASQKGKVLSEEHKTKLSEAQKGKVHSEESKAQRKLSPSQVAEVFQMREEGFLQREIADHFSVTHTTISRILSGKLYKDLQQTK